MKKFVIMVLILITIIATIADGRILRETRLGPFYNNHNYFVELYNIDDSESLTVNGRLIATIGFDQYQLVDITNYLKDGDNIIELENENTWYTWHYGFAIKQDLNNIWSDSCGSPGNGCENSDLTLGVVYRNTIILTLESQYTVPIQPPKSAGFESIIAIMSVIIIYAKEKIFKANKYCNRK